MNKAFRTLIQAKDYFLSLLKIGKKGIINRDHATGNWVVKVKDSNHSITILPRLDQAVTALDPLVKSKSNIIDSKKNISQKDQRIKSEKRKRYFAIVGVDFGTAYTKCIVRDMNIDQSRVVDFGKFSVTDKPYLIESKIHINDGMFVTNLNKQCDAFPYAKMVLSDLCKSKTISPNIYKLWDIYFNQMRNTANKQNSLIYAIGYFLSLVLMHARKLANEMMPGFGSDDLFFVNLCIPVDDMENKEICNSFQKAISIAWLMNSEINNHENHNIEIQYFITKTKSLDLTKAKEMCCIYPEVAANVHAFFMSGFGKSQWGVPYFLSDVGAGTVDQCFFILSPDRGTLTFFSAKVEPLGSSEIEIRMIDALKGSDIKVSAPLFLQQIIEYKEKGGQLPQNITEKYLDIINTLKNKLTNIR